jgi:hypothetical protein
MIQLLISSDITSPFTSTSCYIIGSVPVSKQKNRALQIGSGALPFLTVGKRNDLSHLQVTRKGNFICSGALFVVLHVVLVYSFIYFLL